MQIYFRYMKRFLTKSESALKIFENNLINIISPREVEIFLVLVFEKLKHIILLFVFEKCMQMHMNKFQQFCNIPL